MNTQAETVLTTGRGERNTFTSAEQQEKNVEIILDLFTATFIASLFTIIRVADEN